MACLTALIGAAGAAPAADFHGRYCDGKGDVEFLRLVDESFAFFHANPNTQNISMLYNPDWDSLTEGASWRMWWIQNSYGPTYCALPFLQEPWLTFLQHSQDFWFNHQGDGKMKDHLDTQRPKDAPESIAPDGCLVDAASPTACYHRQGDGEWLRHDWCFEFTAAGIVLQAELLLISRDLEAAHRYLPHLERACDFIETRRDPKNGLFLVGPASNLLAPSYGGVRQPDGSFGKGYLAGLSITYLAALSRMAELQKLVGNQEKTALYEERRKMTEESLPRLLTPAGYFVKSLEPDGTKHGVLGQDKYGYFEGVANVDAIAFRAVDLRQAEKIYEQIAALPELRPNDFLITNYPSLDDTYVNWGSRKLDGIWEFGTWVNGGVWATVEARAITAYYRLGKYEDVRRSARLSMKLAEEFQMDAPLKDFGKTPWFDTNLTNLCYDALGIPAATARGLFEYIYRADGLTLYPHVPPSIVEYHQKEPIRFGEKRISISIKNSGPRIKSLTVNGRKWRVDAPDYVTLAYDRLPRAARVELVTEGGWPTDAARIQPTSDAAEKTDVSGSAELPEDLRKPFALLTEMRKRIGGEPKADFERAFLHEALAVFEAYRVRAARDAAGAYSAMKPEKRTAILALYRDAALKMYTGFDNLMKRYAAGNDEPKRRLALRFASLQ